MTEFIDDGGPRFRCRRHQPVAELGLMKGAYLPWTVERVHVEGVNVTVRHGLFHVHFEGEFPVRTHTVDKTVGARFQSKGIA